MILHWVYWIQNKKFLTTSGTCPEVVFDFESRENPILVN